jgi:hypothetical protein
MTTERKGTMPTKKKTYDTRSIVSLAINVDSLNGSKPLTKAEIKRQALEMFLWEMKNHPETFKKYITVTVIDDKYV